MDETGIQNRIPLPVDRKDVEAVVVFPDGKQMLLVREPVWLRLWLLTCSLVALGVTVFLFGIGALFGAIVGGAGLAFVVFMTFPRVLLRDPGKSHHWPH